MVKDNLGKPLYVLEVNLLLFHSSLWAKALKLLSLSLLWTKALVVGVSLVRFGTRRRLFTSTLHNSFLGHLFLVLRYFSLTGLELDFDSSVMLLKPS